MTTAIVLTLALVNPPVVEPGAGALPAAANPDAVADLGFDQRLGAQVPIDLTFRDEAGRRVTLRDCTGDKPTILVLAYYRCPQLCTLVLNGLLDGMRGMSYAPGEEFNVVTVSFDPRETPAIAAAKREAYVGAYGRPGAASAWHFLTGDAPEIETLATAVGFRYSFDAKNDRFNHASGIVVLTPGGKVSRYLFGLRFAPRDLKLALIDASAGTIGSPSDQFLLFCFQYDHANGRYAFAVLNLMRAAGVLTVIALGVWMARLIRRPSTAPSVTA